MKRIFSLVLALMLLIMPSASLAAGSKLTTEDVLSHLFSELADVASGSTSGLQVTLTDPKGQIVTAGLSSAEANKSIHFSHGDTSLLLTEVSAYLTDKGITSCVSLEELLSAASSMPAIQEQDFAFLPKLGNDLLGKLMLSSSISFNASNNVLNLHIDIDGLLAHLDKIIPELLAAYRTSLDPLLTQYAALIVGQPVTWDQLTAAWNSLGLKNMKTGVILDAFVLSSANGITLISSCKNWNLQASITSTGFSCTVTSPAGKVYPFDTADLMTAISILSTVPNSITEEAFKYEQTKDGSRLSSTVTTHITTDLALVERDLRAGLSQAITANSLTVNSLITKYQTWIDLFYPSVQTVSVDGTVTPAQKPQITAAWLSQQASRLSLLPHIKAEVTAVYNTLDRTLAITGNVDKLQFDAHVANYNTNTPSFTATIRQSDTYNPILLSLSGAFTYGTLSSFNLTSNRDLGGFRSISFTNTTNRVQLTSRNSIHERILTLTTDTDLFHFISSTSNTSQSLDLKLANFELDVSTQKSPNMALHSRWPDGYFDLTTTEDGMELDSTYGGFSFTQADSFIEMEGYVNPDPSWDESSRFTFFVDGENELATLSILPADGGNCHITYRPGQFSILANTQTLLIEDTQTGTRTQNIARISFDGETQATLVSDIVNSEDVIFKLYLGTILDGDCWTLSFDFGAAGQPVPAGAASVTAEEFMNRLEDAFSTSPKTPVTPDATTPAGSAN